MKAVVLDRYGSYDALRVAELPTPAPGDGEVLVRVRAAAVNKGDWHLMAGEPFPVRLVFGLRRPKVRVLGSDLAGIVEAVGPGVTRFAVGDAVFGDLAASGFGAFAEYACAPETALQRKPPNADFTVAGAVAMAGQVALQGLRDHARLQPGQHVLVNGASGNVGMLAVQIAKALGATVTGVCGTRNLEMVRSLGADHVIDYTREDFAAGGARYDVVLDTAAHRPVSDSRRVIRAGGAYVMVGGSTRLLFTIMLLGRWLGGSGKVQVATLIQETREPDLTQLRQWLASGALAPRVDRTASLDQMAGAMRYFREGKPRGKVVVTPTR